MTIHADNQATAKRWRESGRFVLLGEGEWCCFHHPSVHSRYVNEYGMTDSPRGESCICAPPAVFVEAAKAGRLPVTVPKKRPYCEECGPECEMLPHRRVTTDLLAVVEFGPVPVVDRRRLREHLGQTVVTVNPSTGTVRLSRFLTSSDGGRFDPTPMLPLDLPPGIDPSTLPGQWAIGGSIEVAS